MDACKEFQAKTVDLALEEACRFFDAAREALEIEIVSGGSAGIFGLGAKKAVIRASRRRLVPAGSGIAETAPETAATMSAAVSAPDADHEAEQDLEEDDEVCGALATEDQPRLEAEIRAMLLAMLRPISLEPLLTVEMTAVPITVHITDQENSGLIIGRDGQTITALQYLLNRMISKSWPHCPRIRLDAGDYRQKQHEQLQEMALALASKARKSGRVQSTRPLSAFHRRVVHMTLQQGQEVQTRSKGDGPVKRVLIIPVKKKSARAQQESARTAPAKDNV